MQQNFERCTKWLLVHEGGYVNHPRDPGGATNKGVTQRVYDGYRGRIGKPRRSVRHITSSEVMEIYRSQYWNTIHGDDLPSGLDYSMYDYSVNSGPSRAIKDLQRLLGVKADGVMGNVTLCAIRSRKDIEGLITELCLHRWNWMKRLKTWNTFGKGWTRRVMGDIIRGVQPGTDHGVIDRSIMMVREVQGIPGPIQEASGKAEEVDLKPTEKAKDSINFDNMLKISAGGVPGAIAAAASVPPGPLQWAVAVAVVIVVCAVVFAVYHKILK